MSINIVTYSNTFLDWVTTTNLLVNKVNIIDTSDYVKSNGTFSIAVPAAFTSTLDISGRTTITYDTFVTAGTFQFSNTANAVFSTNTFFHKEITSNNVIKLNDVYANGMVYFGNTSNLIFGNNSSLKFTSNNIIGNLNSEFLGGYNSNYYISITNTSINQAQSAFNRANSAYGQANTAIANTILLFGIDATQNTAISAAFSAANNEPIAKSSFDQANLAYGQANTAIANTVLLFGIDVTQNTSISLIQGVDNTQNAAISAAFSAANNEPIAKSSFDRANSAYSQANAAYSQANTGTTQAQAAFGRANSAYNQANTANTNAANASFLSTGTVPTARLASGTANSITYLRGDSTWATVVSGATITDTSSAGTYYLGMSTGTSGAWTSAYVSSSKLYFNPGDGTLYSTIFSSLSDQKLKENVEPLLNSTEIINNISPVSFSWKDSGKISYGVIAQEIEKVLPNIVNEVDDVKSVEYQSLIAFLIGAIKELAERIEKLENK
jgi:hypothetical protein